MPQSVAPPQNPPNKIESKWKRDLGLERKKRLRAGSLTSSQSPIRPLPDLSSLYNRENVRSNNEGGQSQDGLGQDESSAPEPETEEPEENDSGQAVEQEERMRKEAEEQRKKKEEEEQKAQQAKQAEDFARELMKAKQTAQKAAADKAKQAAADKVKQVAAQAAKKVGLSALRAAIGPIIAFIAANIVWIILVLLIIFVIIAIAATIYWCKQDPTGCVVALPGLIWAVIKQIL